MEGEEEDRGLISPASAVASIQRMEARERMRTAGGKGVGGRGGKREGEREGMEDLGWVRS